MRIDRREVKDVEVSEVKKSKRKFEADLTRALIEFEFENGGAYVSEINLMRRSVIGGPGIAMVTTTVEVND